MRKSETSTRAPQGGSAQSESAPGPFDRRVLRIRRNRAADGFDEVAFLVERAALEIVDRLDDIKRTYDVALDLGSHTGSLSRHLQASKKVSRVIACDTAEAMLRHITVPRFVADEDCLPVANEALDLIVSALSLHWVNDLPGMLIQARRALKPDGLLLAALLGGNTLHELRDVLITAESELTGGAAARVAPFADVRSLGGLLQRAGLALPVVDSDQIVVRYDDIFALVRDLRRMGGANALVGARPPLHRNVLLHAASLYADRYSDEDGRIRATFEIVYLTGWAPHESQQKPLAPGSARTRLAEALGTEEKSAGEPANAATDDRFKGDRE